MVCLDVLANMVQLPSNPLLHLLFRLSGSAPGYRIFNLALMATVKNKKLCCASNSNGEVSIGRLKSFVFRGR